MRISDWSSDVRSSDLLARNRHLKNPALSLNSASCRDHPPECPGKIPQLLPEACQPGGLIDQQPIPPWRLTPRETHRSEARFYEPLAPCLGRLHQDDLLFGQWLHLHSPGSHRFVQKSSRHRGANHDKPAPVLFLTLRIAPISAIPGIVT